MYSGGFYPYKTLEEYWAFWSRAVFLNRYCDAAAVAAGVYGTLLNIARGKNYFVIITDVDHCFQKAGFDKSRLFYTQGDYGLFQCSVPCHRKTYGNEEAIKAMVAAQNGSICPNVRVGERVVSLVNQGPMDQSMTNPKRFDSPVPCLP